MQYRKPIVVAEMCCNHAGDMNVAKQMIRMCDICAVDVVKFQKRDIVMQALLSPRLYNGPHPNPIHAFGATYKEHRQVLEFNMDQHAELKQYIETFGMEYSSSAWDEVSAVEVAALLPPFIKVPSACNQSYAMLDILKECYEGDIHISLGMTTDYELASLLAFWKDHFNRIVLYACTTGYPVPAEEMHLLEIEKLLKIGVKGVGLSSHYAGYAMCLEAQALGAGWFEKHITLDRFSKGTDHSAALEFVDLRNLVRDLREGFKALTFKDGDTPLEKVQRAKLKA